MYRVVVRQLLLVVILVFATSSCGGGEPREAEPRPLPWERQALSPGTYVPEEFEPSFSFEVGEGWATLPPELSDNLRLTRGETAGMSFARIRQVYEPTETSTPSLVEAPEDMVAWFRRHPYLRTDRPEPATIGGIRGVWLDVELGELPEDHYGVCGTDCVDIARLSGGTGPAIREGIRTRLIVLEDVNGETVTVGFGSPAEEFDEFAPEAQRVLDTVRWRTS